jgi:formylglycine-generating enzyme required for sulfatase activity
MACVLGGWFERGSDDAKPDERPRARVYVDTFFLDLYEVTNARYEPCLREGVCKPPKQTFEHYSGEEQPVVAISWFDAVAFCRREGKRLPTEAEFERAASGPNTTKYSWGDEAVDCKRAIIETRLGKGCGRGTTWPVGSREPGHFGLYDMGGNVWEWVADWYSPCYGGCENECGEACEGKNPKGPCGGAADCPSGTGLRVLRGGSWWHPLERARASARRAFDPVNPNPSRFGFRCAKDLR